MPQRGFAFLLAAEMGSGTILLWALPAWVTARWGTAGAILLIGSMIAASGIVCPWLPRAAPQSDEKPVGSASTLRGGTLTPWAGVVALTMHVGLFTGLWAFLERIGLDRTMSAIGVGQLLMGAMALATALALAASQLGGNGRLVRPLTAAMMTQCIGTIVLMTGGKSIADFVAGALLIVGPFALIISYQLALIAGSDTTGKVAAFSGGAQLIGVAIGPAIVGSLITDHGYQSALAAFMVVTLVSLSVFIHVSRRVALPQPT